MPEQKLIFRQKPQINISCPSTGRMWLVSVCAFLCVLQSALTDNGQSLIIAVAAVFTAIIIELLLTWRQFGASKIKDGSAAATALILSLLLPNQIHPVYAALGAAFAIVVVKYSFGGLGSNWLNPALGGWLFIRFSWPSVFVNALENHASEMTVSGLSTLDTSVTAFFNDTVFSLAGVQLPSGYINLLFFNSPGMIVDRGLFALLLGTVIITVLGINRGWVPLVFLAVYGFLIRLAGDTTEILWNGDLLYGLFSGGTIAAAFILAAEPASSAKLWQGVLFSVVLGAVLSWFFRYRCMEYTGCLIALALVNCLTPLIRLLEDKIFFSRKNSGMVPENFL
ncbi:MAG: RnfABCDGE type electron transport complex subunit D [Treponema sp.]|jgi:electron transport complex protein RnfD|nr:RnfABCDGE type electron transport complex subunit D [Treponema sp.]